MNILSLFLGVCAFLGALAFMRLARINKKIDELELKLKNLTTLVEATKTRNINQVNESIIGQIPPSDALRPQVTAPPLRQPRVSQTPAQKPPSVNIMPSIAIHTPLPNSVEVAFAWLKENWAGFLGVSILVLGITFGTVYLSFFATPFVRFLILIGIGFGFLGAAQLIRGKPLWLGLSFWLRSASGAIVLFAVLASGFIEALHFYHSAQIGLFLLIAGLSYNVILAYFAAKEVFAAFHVLISLIALMIVPKELAVYFTAVMVCLAGIGLSIKHPWNSNLAISFISYSIFHILWLKGQPQIQPIAPYGVIGTSVVGACALLVHYLKIYQAISRQYNLFSHLSIWLFLGFGLALYNVGFPYLCIPLGIATLACFGACLYARKQNIGWLFVCDALVGQVLAVITIVSLSRVNLNHEMIAWVALIESVCFATVTYWVRQYLLSKVGLGFTLCAYLILLVMLININPVQICMITAGTLVPLYIIRNLLMHKTISTVLTFDTFEEAFPNVIDCLFFVLAFVSLLLGLSAYLWGYSLLLAALFLMTFNKNLIAQENHRFLFLIFSVLVVVYSWYKVSMIENVTTSLVYYGLPPVLLLIWLFKEKIFYLEENQSLEDMWVYLVGIHAAILATNLTFGYSPFIPGASFLIFGLLFFEAGLWLCANIQSMRSCFIAIACKNMAVIYLIAYGFLYLLLYLQSEASLHTYLSLSQALTLIASVLSLYWYFSKPIHSDAYPDIEWRISVKALTLTQTITFDIAFIFILCLLISTFSAPIHPIGYAALGLVLSGPQLRKYLPTRALAYAVCLLIATCVQVAVVSSKWASPLSDWYQNTHITGPISMVLAMGVASFLMNKPTENENTILKIYYKNPVLIGLLPVFTALGFFLMWRFDKAYLTMLWVVEIALVVAIGFYLRSKALVHIALLFLLFCVGRLLIYDLAQTALIIKAFVFIVIGLLMIFIHVIYKKYASRLS